MAFFIRMDKGALRPSRSIDAKRAGLVVNEFNDVPCLLRIVGQGMGPPV